MQEFIDIFSSINIIALIMFITGLLLLIVEMFIPGFGIAGASGIILLVLAAVFQAKTLTQGLILIVLVGLIIGVMAVIFFRSASKGALYRSDIVLKEQSTKAEAINCALKAGDRGVAFTMLRPSGIAIFNDIKYDVLTQGNFILKDTPVKIIAIEGNKIFVEKNND